MTPQALIAPARLAGIPLLRTQTDERLVDLVRSGNDAAFEAIVARYRRPLLRYCSRFLPEESADDAVQQVFVRAYDALRNGHAEMHLRPWLYRIAHNTALNALRARTPRHEQLSEEIDGVERPDQAYEKNQRLREVVSAVGMLPDRQRNALVLRELEGRSYEEIAASLGVSNGAVRQLLNRARTTLRAGATAITPPGLLTRIPWPSGTSSGTAGRVAELCGGTAGGAVLAKVCATALVTGAVLGGVAAAPDGGDESTARPAPTPQRSAHVATRSETQERASAPGTPRLVSRRNSGNGGTGEGRHSGTGNGSEDRRGSDAGGSSGPGRDDRSGPDAGGGERSGTNSGPGSGSDGSGSGGSDDSGSGSGSSGPGSGSTELTSGSDGSDSGTGGSGSGTSGSGTSGSGSGSSGSGSGDSAQTTTSGSDGQRSGSSGSDSGEPTATP
jgi:RNA polymerase sigma factor (sigma-70 family)